ncbi:MAG: hypothetical protein LBJ71_02140 [Holosporaceae bacterium]|jgi:hypothetical protein|nr:hypothetical protein [Holosporaceae bacterium]
MKKIIFLAGVLFFNGVSGMFLTLDEVKGLSLKEVKERLSTIVQYSGREYFREVALSELESLNQNNSLISDCMFLSGIVGLFKMVDRGIVNEMDEFYRDQQRRGYGAWDQRGYDRAKGWDYLWGETMESLESSDLPVIRERAAVIVQKFHTFGRNLVLDEQLLSLSKIDYIYRVLLDTRDAAKDSQTISQAQESLQRIAGGVFDKDTITAASDFCDAEINRKAREERAEQLTGILEEFKKIKEDISQWNSFFDISSSLGCKVGDPMRMMRYCIEDLCQQKGVKLLDFSDAKAKISSVGAIEMILSRDPCSWEDYHKLIFRQFITLLDSCEEDCKQRLFGEFSDALDQTVRQLDRLPPYCGVFFSNLALFGAIYQTFLLFPR